MEKTNDVYAEYLQCVQIDLDQIEKPKLMFEVEYDSDYPNITTLSSATMIVELL